jgi:hypothetical protein
MAITSAKYARYIFFEPGGKLFDEIYKIAKVAISATVQSQESEIFQFGKSHITNQKMIDN